MSKFKYPSDSFSDNLSVIKKESVTKRGDIRTVFNEYKNSHETEKPKSIETKLLSGEIVPKYHKILIANGILDELCSFLGIIKCEHLSERCETKDIDNSCKLFFFARLTQIQEALVDIQISLSTTKKNSTKFENTRFINGETRIKELESEISLMTDVDFPNIKNTLIEQGFPIIAGTSLIESRLLFARSLCRRAERQFVICAKNKMNIFPEENCLLYLNRLSDYLLCLSIHILHIQNKEPLKKVFRTNKITHSNLK